MLSLVAYAEGMTVLVSGQWQRLADYVRSARVARGFASQMALATAAGVSEGSVRSLESGRAYTRMPVVVPAVERALGWPPGTMRRLVEGEEPDGLHLFPEAEQERPTLTPDQRDKFRELVLRSSLNRAAKNEVLAEIDATPVVSPTDE
jgi:hypothetical protein